MKPNARWRSWKLVAATVSRSFLTSSPTSCLKFLWSGIMLRSAISALALLGLTAGTIMGVADDEKKPGSFKIEAPGVRIEGRAPDARPAGRPVRASKVIGVKVLNADKTNLGT